MEVRIQKKKLFNVWGNQSIYLFLYLMKQAEKKFFFSFFFVLFFFKLDNSHARAMKETDRAMCL